MGAANFVTIDKMDLVVLGQVQYSYSMGGVSGYDLGQVSVASAFRRVTSVENEITTVSAACEARAKKIEDLGKAMGTIQYAMAYIGDKMDNETITVSGLSSIKPTLVKYNIPDSDLAKDTLTVSELRTLNENVKHEIDQEDNALQRTTSTLQNVMGKRDSDFSTVSKIEEKYDNTAKATIQNIGS